MSRRLILASATGLALIAVVAWSVVQLTRPAPTNVIVLTVEGARADTIAPDITPRLWRLSGQGTRFANHRAVSAWTATNILSILTGLSPTEHGVHTRGQSVAAGWPLALETLGQDGWRVAGLQSFMLVDVFKSVGLTVDAGADLFGWLGARRVAGEPFVLWYHYLDTHLPYNPASAYMPDWRALLPPGDAGDRVAAVTREPALPAGSVPFEASDRAAVVALYRAGFREFDDWFAEFWAFLEASGLRRNTIVVLTADHGEELLERGQVGHASTTRAGHLHEEIVRVPLIVWLPPGDNRLPPGGVVEDATDHLDILPTLLALLERDSPVALHGADLTTAAPERPWTAVTSRAGYAEPDPTSVDRFIHARREGRWKLHVHRQREAVERVQLFDLDRDPGETRDLSQGEPHVVERMLAAMLSDLATARRPEEAAPAVARSGPRPQWRHPPSSGSYAYDDAAGRFWLEWSGPPTFYVLQYEAGRGLLKMAGEIRVTGTRKDFGIVDRHYWDTWITAYGPYRVRVGYDGPDPNWSDWLEITVE